MIVPVVVKREETDDERGYEAVTSTLPWFVLHGERESEWK